MGAVHPYSGNTILGSIAGGILGAGIGGVSGHALSPELASLGFATGMFGGGTVVIV